MALFAPSLSLCSQGLLAAASAQNILNFKVTLLTVERAHSSLADRPQDADAMRQVSDAAAAAHRAMLDGTVDGDVLVPLERNLIDAAMKAPANRNGTPEIRSMRYPGKREAYENRCHPTGLQTSPGARFVWVRRTKVQSALNEVEAYIAALGHELWRETRPLLQDATEKAYDGQAMREPRWKPVGTEDPTIISGIPTEFMRTNTESGELELDIANLPYENLSPEWQSENKANARAMRDLLELQLAELTTDQANDTIVQISERELAGFFIHNRWLGRPGNSWAKGGDLDVPFDELDAVNQERDINPFINAIERMNAAFTERGLNIQFRLVA